MLVIWERSLQQMLTAMPSLTSRENDVLRLVCNGYTNREIGRELYIAESTARGHVQSVIRKMQVKNRTACAAEGVRRNLVI